MSETPQSASQAFFSGCKSGLNLALYGILPRVMVAFIFISVLEACGAMSLIGDIFTPLMPCGPFPERPLSCWLPQSFRMPQL